MHEPDCKIIKGSSEEILYFAKAFDDLAVNINRTNNIEKKAKLITFAVNCAFAIELYLKFLLSKSNSGKENKSTHNFSQLFEKLTPTVKVNIKKSYSELIANMPSEIKHENEKYIERIDDFESVLKQVEGTFVNARYCYEPEAEFKALLFEDIIASIKKEIE